MRTPTAGTRRAPAFTLVEILIVVVILAILAAIVIPQFVSASIEATKSSLHSQLKTINDQIEIYRVNNVGRLPTQDPVAPFGQNGSWGALVVVPYLKTTPFNMYAGGSVLAAGTSNDAYTAAKGSATGWFYQESGNRLFVWAAGYDERNNKLSVEP